MLTLKHNKMIKVCPQLYKFVPTNMRFDYMFKDNPWFEFHCRIVIFKITDDTYECIITHLDRNKFPVEDIQYLYNKRWGIETLFREFKYVIGLNALNSKKRKLIQQEIHARVIPYNFCQRIVQVIKIPPIEHLITKDILLIRSDRSKSRHVQVKTVVCFNYRYD